jgi:hypothetical protein
MTPQTRPDEISSLSRRAVLNLGLTLGVVAAAGPVLAGCSVNNPLSHEETPAVDAVRDLEPDVAVAVEAATLVRAAESAVTGTSKAHAGLAPRLAGLLAAHRAHLEAVVDAVPDGVDTSTSGPAYVVPTRPKAAMATLVAAEHTLHDELMALAMRAESGPFARLLGAMAAAVSQQLQGLTS